MQELNKFDEERKNLWKKTRLSTTGFSRPLRKKIKQYALGNILSHNMLGIMDELMIELISRAGEKKGGESDAIEPHKVAGSSVSFFFANQSISNPLSWCS